MPLPLPHGGQLLDLTFAESARAAQLAEADGLRHVELSPRQLCDLELLAVGSLSPLAGFQGSQDFERVCREFRLANGTLWPVPIVLAVPDDVAGEIAVGDKIALVDSEERVRAILNVSEKFRRNRKLEFASVYGTDDLAHPGVAASAREGDWCLAGPVRVIDANPEPEFPEYRLTPRQTRQLFASRGWNTVAAFQTRNPIHRAHEYLTKCALEVTDGLLIHPVVGETKSDDIPADARLRCYRALIERYYSKDRVALAVLPLAMSYAGPREALLHALIRKNYGATHFIVGRDHAGVGNYYGTYDAQRIFDRFDPAEIGITPLKFENAFYCRQNNSMATEKTTASSPEQRVSLSGTKVRELLRAGRRPPEEFTRPEVADVLIEWARSELAATGA